MPPHTTTRQYRVLDAGCGANLASEVPPDAYVVGIDISASALARNEWIDERIVANIETYTLPLASFDLVVCANVLEHLDAPVAAVRNLASAVRVGGEIEITMPILWCAKGMLTKLTPHRFHVWCYRRLLGFERAGEEGYGPFRTRFKITPGTLERELRRAGFDLVSKKTWRADLKLPGVLRVLWRLLCGIDAVLSPSRGATEYRARFKRRSA